MTWSWPLSERAGAFLEKMKLPCLFAGGVAVLALLLACAGCHGAEPATPPPPSARGGIQAPPHETAAENDARMAWWREARFGLFLHWGVYSVPAGEWNGHPTDYAEWFLEQTKMPVSQYEKFAARFDPVKFNATDWVRMAKDAGMKYIVITAKHHDGFGMFRSDLTDWCIKSTPFQRDPLKELSDACRKAGIRLCFYYSIMDWHHPDWGQRRAWNDLAKGEPDMDRYVAYMKGQLKELLTRYGPIGVLWFDGEWENPWTPDRGIDLYNYVRGLQPAIIVNNRVGKARAGLAGMDQGAGKIGDYGTPEQQIPSTGFGAGVDWESCMTMNDHWGYNKYDQDWKSAESLVRNLIDCASKGGNYLLNIGPTSEGVFPPGAVERLKEIGGWMSVNGESIYGTTASPFARLRWGRCTKKLTSDGATLYLHVFEWPRDGKLSVEGLRNPVQKAYLLAEPGTDLPVATAKDGVVISIPAAPLDAISSTIVLKVRGALDVVQPPAVSISADAQGVVRLSASAAELHGTQIRYESGASRDCIGWWFNPDESADWLVRIDQPGKFNVIAETASTESASFGVRVGGQVVKGTAAATGDFGKFETWKLGTLDIAAAETATVKLEGVREGWHPLNVRSIRLEPEPPR